MIRSSLLSSETLASLSHPAERLFFRLVVLADDFGRYHASPRFIRSSAMGLLNVSVPSVGQWLRELHEAKAICIYNVGDRPFLAFSNWPRHQRLRAKTSKFPPHDGCACGHAPQSAASADIGGHMPPESESESESESEKKISLVEIRFARFWEGVHRKIGKEQTFAEFKKLNPSDELTDKMIAANAEQRTWKSPHKPGEPYPMQDPVRWVKNRRWQDEQPIGGAGAGNGAVSRPYTPC